MNHLEHHIEKTHPDMIPDDMTVSQYLYFKRTGKSSGSCVVCHSATTWNDKTKKYHRFCTKPSCKEEYRGIFKARMIGRYGKINLLNDPDQQRKMLAHRSITKEYIWTENDKTYKFPCTGSYEYSFCSYLDLVMNWDPEDLMMPSPHTFYYKFEDRVLQYIPDAYIPSLNLQIEIKDGGDNPNMHHKILAVDKVKEQCKDSVMESNKMTFNYLKIINKDNNAFNRYLELNDALFVKGTNQPIIMI